VNISRKQFNEFRDLVLGALDDNRKDERYGTDHDIAESLLNESEESLFSEEIAKGERRAQYLALKAEFEGGDEELA
jgi:hypothetical protein